MKIISWNVAGLRAILKKECFHEFVNNVNNVLPDSNIICLQETKAEESQVNLPDYIKQKYPYRYWNSTKGTTQRKGFSGTTIWCPRPPIKCLSCPAFDEEGRIVALEFEKFILINVYVPNSQKLDSERYKFRATWNSLFSTYINEIHILYPNKEIIICGDLNVAHENIDISNPSSKRNKIAGFFDLERDLFGKLLSYCELTDIYRHFNPEVRASTYWSNFLKTPRSEENGWRIDYFLLSKKTNNIYINNCYIKHDIMGSDHCPIVLDLTL